jgi:hypothetical protein
LRRRLVLKAHSRRAYFFSERRQRTVGLSYRNIAKIVPRLTIRAKESSLFFLGGKAMKTHLSGTRKFGMLFAVAFLALQAAPAVAADSGSGAYVRTEKGEKPFSVTFKDVYAFRVEDTDKNKTQVTVVILSELPMDKKAMTAALKKERDEMALNMDPKLAAYTRIVINQKGEIHGYKFYSRRITDSDPAGEGDAKVNTAKRVEGSFSSNYSGNNWGYKLDLRFATDLADVGPGTPVKIAR